jgi:hypothetical protein
VQIITGLTDIPTAGTPTQLSTSTRRAAVLIFNARVGTVRIVDGSGGTPGLSATTSTEPRKINFAEAGGALALNTIYFTAGTNGDDVEWTAIIP